MMKRPAPLAVIAFAFSACAMLGPSGPLPETADRLGDIRSGTLSFKLAATTRGGTETGFELKGPFSMPSGASLAAARLEYRQVGTSSGPVFFISTGKTAYIQTGGRAYQLPDERVSGLRGSGDSGDHGPFDALDIANWVKEPRVSAGPKVDGVSTQRIRGDLEVPTALNNLFDMARDLGQSDLPRVKGDDAEHLQRAVKSARIDLVTGREDRFLRRMSMFVNLGAESPKRLSPRLQELLGVHFRLDMTISNPNKPVKVDPPANPLPFSRLESSSARQKAAS